MTIACTQVVTTLANCLQDEAQAEKVRRWAERQKQSDPDAPGLDSASAALLFAAALGDATSWKALQRMHPMLADLDLNNMPSVLDRLFAGSQP